MNKELKEAYLKVRGSNQSYSAQTAHSIASANRVTVKRDYVLAPSPYLLGARFSRGGLDISISCDYDHNPDTSWLGGFTNKWAPNAIRHFGGRNSYKYFVPEVGPMDNYENYHNAGYSKHQAWVLSREAWLSDYRRMAALINEDWCCVGMTVKVSVGGIALGEASLWGMEDDADICHFYDTADDLIHEATEEAKAAAKTLMGAIGDMAFGEDKTVHKQEVGVA